MTKKTERTLYQFPISHYCEKTRWNLDAKRSSISYSMTSTPTRPTTCA
jgi:hypothetical protein